MARDLRAEYGFFDKLMVWFSANSVIVLTMGKVGTLTVCNSLEHVGFRNVHPHSLFYTRPGVHFIDVALTPRQRFWYAYKTVTKRLKVALWHLLSGEILIITGVRDPFSRAISAYFEQSHYFGGIPEDWGYEEIKADLEKRAFFEATTTWFDDEIKRFSRIDVLASDFDHKLGYKTFRKGKVRLFVYRMGKLDGLGTQIAEFLGLERFDILKANDTSDSRNAEKYREFIGRYKYDPALAAKLIRTRYVQTFFSADEIAALEARWVGPQSRRRAASQLDQANHENPTAR